MSTYILGLSCYYHDSAAALLKDGSVVAAAAEERFTRVKHDHSFPINAIQYCLQSQKITIKAIEHIGCYEKPILKLERILSQHLESFPRSYKTFLTALPSWINEKLRIIQTIRKRLKYGGDVFFLEHHLSHAASAFLVSPFQEAAIVTVDGIGEWTTTAYGMGRDTSIHLMKEIRFPHSLGLLYSTLTAYLGFRVNNSEYKVMGLAAYGDRNKETNSYYKKLRGIIDLKEDGSYHLDMDYFIYHYADRMPSSKMCKLLGLPIRTSGSELTQNHKDIAAALQLVYEEVIFKLLHHVYRKTRCKNLVMAGGCSLNSVANGKILGNTPFENIWIHPDPGDAGASIGVASYIYHSLLGRKREYELKDAYLGPEFSSGQIDNFLNKNKIKHTRFKDERDLVKKTAELICNNQVVGWFQGRMEWGPRALGSRSILSNPCNPKMQEILNVKVKHREKFRPFAPAICEDDVSAYFVCDSPLPKATDFMLMVYPIREEWHPRIPSVTHVDGSGRLQTIKRDQSPLYYDVIKEFGRLSGIPIVINTSFNIRGEPIVCTPQDAYRCVMGTEIDHLIMGEFMIKREDNPQDMWDNETDVRD